CAGPPGGPTGRHRGGARAEPPGPRAAAAGRGNASACVERGRCTDERDLGKLRGSDQGKLRRFLDGQSDAAFAGDALETGGQFGIELEVAADEQLGLAPALYRAP